MSESGSGEQQGRVPPGKHEPVDPTNSDLISSVEAIPSDAKYIAPYGDDAWPGTVEKPWKSILQSFQKLQPGETLVIRSGTYTFSGHSETCQNGIAAFGLIGKRGNEQSWTTIVGYPGERPKLYHPDGWQTLYICDSSYVRVQNLEVFGDANSGNHQPANGVYVVDSHHVIIQDVWSHDNGGCGICTRDSNHVVITGNRVWGNSHWNPYQTSGISVFYTSNEGGENDADGYSNYVTNNLVWDNYADESLGEGQQWGVTDGNGIIVDETINSGGLGRTLVRNNVIVGNGGPGVMVTRSQRVDIIGNTLYKNVRTRVQTVVNNGDIGCNGSRDVRVENNLVVPYSDTPDMFVGFMCEEYSLKRNVWVRTGAPAYGPEDIVLPSGSTVLSDPRDLAPAGCWSAVGNATGYGASLRQ